ncbi:MAG: Membrane protein, GtrA superfamily [Candidatus Nomurabacteria bacterium GW2011_GWF2_43_8]|uniref:Membrane protein, GtrA superfamily n=1 Tax=Candidatus Nomurabacteria bacterium GW2011_GWF2_43_8 TaxID=1618779 RepID=A0A0G1FJE3_9BACT|nr:MAG: Membrane protein, GtrA superfamily [Candidatus Nomurabacteria bacterium GW2011_GWF2_43_8]
MKLNLAIPKFIRFAIVGVVNTVIDLSILNILILIFGLSQPFLFPFYKGFSFICAFLNSYFMNKNFTFRSKENKKYTFYIFCFFSFVGFLMNVIFSSLLFFTLISSHIFLNTHIIATFSGIFGTIVGLIINYLSYNNLVFK